MLLCLVAAELAAVDLAATEETAVLLSLLLILLSACRLLPIAVLRSCPLTKIGK